MSQPYHFLVAPTIINRKQSLTINPDKLEYKNNSFLKNEIIALRYGVKAIRGYHFNIGRIYYIDIKNESGKIIKLRLKSIYGIRKKILAEKYQEIANALYENYFNDFAGSYVTLFNNKIDFNILGTIVTQEGIILEKNRELISWLDLETKRYWHYGSIFSISDPHNSKSYYYIDDWNAGILLSVIEYLIKAKKPF